MKLSELAGEKRFSDVEITGLTADSRAVKPGFLFVALSGAQTDGAAYIPQAEEKGAAAILTRPGTSSHLPMIVDDAPRKRLAEMAARFYPRQPEIVAGITGTNGKTSTAQFAAQLWSMLRRQSGSIGTLGVHAEGFEKATGLTTPDPVVLHQALDAMADAGVTRLAMEVSSHALAQARADGVKFNIAAFTNITQDHLDYHDSFDDYLKAKRRLFAELLESDGVAVVNQTDLIGRLMGEAATSRGARIVKIGRRADELNLSRLEATPDGLDVSISAAGERYDLKLPLVGAFQAENALLAAGIVIAAGESERKVLPLLEKLEPVPGRMEFVGMVAGGAIYVDYAHTPDAVTTALQSIRPHVEGRLIVIIGAGGDRDKDKRLLMGEAAQKHADTVIVTDDNPRTEDPADIRRQIMEGCPQAEEIGDREEAIVRGTAMLQPGGVLLIAGKGHEAGQIVGGETLPFSDVDVARAAALNRSKELG